MKHDHPRCEHCRMNILVGQEVYSCDCCNKIWHKYCFSEVNHEKKKKFPIPIPTYTFDKKGGGKALG